jgi:hypothetical protein
MNYPHLYLLVSTALCCYCTGASWLLQIVAYPGYRLVGEREFVPFHVDFGKRLIPVTVVPMLLTNLLLFGLVFYHPGTVPDWPIWLAAGSAVVILATTFALEIPKHNRLVRDNLPRSLAWTVASASLLYLLAGA